MKTLTFTLLALVISSLSIFGQSSSYFIREDINTTDETDIHTYEHINMSLSVRYSTTYVYEYDNWRGKTLHLPTQDHHPFFMTNKGDRLEEANQLYDIEYENISPGDTLVLITFFCDSLQGFSVFTKHSFIGATRSGETNIESILSKDELKIYPNPVKEAIHLKDINSPFTYMLYDIQGRAIIGGNETDNNIDASFLKTGQYILQITCDQKEYSTLIQKL